VLVVIELVCAVAIILVGYSVTSVAGVAEIFSFDFVVLLIHVIGLLIAAVLVLFAVINPADVVISVVVLLVFDVLIGLLIVGLRQLGAVLRMRRFQL
jgi:hypothetical protein